MTHAFRVASSSSISLRSISLRYISLRSMALHLFAALLMASSIAMQAEASRIRHRPHTLLRSIHTAPMDISSELIIDARTGEVLHAKDASAQRYPASLTKMMTLYLTFDALKAGKMRLNQQLPISTHAASMPATNLALRPGSYLPVETAIKALVVRSANDAAVVLGEALGGSEPQFAELMTRKARQLGMNGTVFKNASGLPNIEQHTTARDLAVLALALNKHFPQYYSYFKTTEFVFNGKNYTTHNRVLLKYPGCDGLKTGFINASGFNLVSAVHRNNRYLVGVVMGSPTWASRDRHMMDLFDQALGIHGAPMSVIGNTGRVGVSKTAHAVSEIAVAAPKSGSNAVSQNVAKAEIVSQEPVMEAEAQGDTDKTETVLTTAAVVLPAPKAIALAPPASVSARVISASVSQAQTLDAQLNRSRAGGVQVAMQSSPAAFSAAAGAGWGIQVGAYAKAAEAQAAARKVQMHLPTELSHAQAQAVSDSSGLVQRARLGGLSEQEARNACRKLVQEREACFVFQAN